MDYIWKMSLSHLQHVFTHTHTLTHTRVCVHTCMLSHFSRVWLFATLWTIACQAPLSMGSSRQEYWSGLSCPSPGDLPSPGIKPMSLTFPALAGRFITTSAIWEAYTHTHTYIQHTHTYTQSISWDQFFRQYNKLTGLIFLTKFFFSFKNSNCYCKKVKPRQHVKKQRHYFVNKGPSSQGYSFSSSHVWMWELDYKVEYWRTDAFELWCWRRLLRVPWTARRSNQSILKGNQSWVFIGRTDVEAETPIF